MMKSETVEDKVTCEYKVIESKAAKVTAVLQPVQHLYNVSHSKDCYILFGVNINHKHLF